MSKPPILVGLIGAGIQSSLSPARREREGEAQGFRYAYRRAEPDTERMLAHFAELTRRP